MWLTCMQRELELIKLSAPQLYKFYRCLPCCDGNVRGVGLGKSDMVALLFKLYWSRK